ncbi:GDCCVxC domain-containing (seleno)protein [Arthrobacter sp. FB24]|uniref:GDCCVxC domain-containing (seleno)protein n=1 Tax=Arthrobacter sp. (strain FB24) TaxID=290399 RepID=UPI000A0489EE|nr:GDCCVxC domain-containing (seleno)protein [Arthrobacter sp. FB24]
MPFVSRVTPDSSRGLGRQVESEVPVYPGPSSHPQQSARCAACGVTSKPKAGDCCVFCSYGDTRCPPLQSP